MVKFEHKLIAAAIAFFVAMGFAAYLAGVIARNFGASAYYLYGIVLMFALLAALNAFAKWAHRNNGGDDDRN